MSSQEIKAKIKMLDKLADDETISDAEFDAINAEIADLYKELATAEKAERKAQVKEITKLSPWYQKFLSSFDTIGTRKVTNKQAYYLQQVNHGKPFAYNGKIYSGSGPDYRAGFGILIVEEK